MSSEKVIYLKEDNFEEQVINSSVPVLIDFYADWCMPCKALVPIVDEMAEEVSDKYKICKMNVDENRSTAMKYGVMSIPTVIIFKDGKEVIRKVGVQQKAEYISALASL